MIKSDFEKEIETAFELAYTPVMLVKQRLNGQDFLETAVPLLDQIRNQFGDNSEKVKIAARTMVLAFNDKLTPQMSTAYSGDSRSPIPMISVHSVGDLLYRRQS